MVTFRAAWNAPTCNKNQGEWADQQCGLEKRSWEKGHDHGWTLHLRRHREVKGIKGSGTCKTTGTADGGLEYTCTGKYTIAAAAAAKQ